MNPDPKGAQRARQRRSQEPERLPRLTAEPDGLLDNLLNALGVEDIATWFIYQTPNGWYEAVIDRADGEQTTLPKKARTHGGAVDNLFKWAEGRGIIVAGPTGVLRQYVNPQEDSDSRHFQ